MSSEIFCLKVMKRWYGAILTSISKRTLDLSNLKTTLWIVLGSHSRNSLGVSSILTLRWHSMIEKQHFNLTPLVALLLLKAKWPHFQTIVKFRAIKIKLTNKRMDYIKRKILLSKSSTQRRWRGMAGTYLKSTKIVLRLWVIKMHSMLGLMQPRTTSRIQSLTLELRMWIFSIISMLCLQWESKWQLVQHQKTKCLVE